MYRYIGLFLITLFITFNISCDQSSTGNDNEGQLIVKFTDDPFPIEQVNQVDLKISKIEIRLKDGDNEENPFKVIFEQDTLISFIDLRNGVTADMPEVDLPIGTYDLVRVYIDSASIGLADGSFSQLKVPSAAQSGLKIFIKPAIQIQGGLTSELLLDYDIAKSFNTQGNYKSKSGIKGFHFKPVIRACNLSTSGRIIGMVTDTSGTLLSDAQVWIEQDSIVATTYTNKDGYYGILGVLAGTYDIYCTKTDYDTMSVLGIDVIPGNLTQQDFILTMQQ
jgi:hypothetical protein